MEGDIYVMNEIDPYWGIDPGVLCQEINSMRGYEVINVHIDSPGGLAFGGIAIYNMLRMNAAAIRVYVHGLAASAASVIAMAGDEIIMGEGAMMMIHGASSFMWGNASDLRKEADVLDSLSAEMAAIYAKKTGKPIEEIMQMMADETWMGGASATEMGFATAIDAGVSQEVAKYDIRRFNFRKMPTEIAARFEANKGKARAATESQEIGDTPAPDKEPTDTTSDSPAADTASGEAVLENLRQSNLELRLRK